MIIAKTSMTELPIACTECNFTQCRLPEKKTGTDLLKKYLKERHASCPLVDVESYRKK
jgi:hypothetical protein